MEERNSSQYQLTESQKKYAVRIPAFTAILMTAVVIFMLLITGSPTKFYDPVILAILIGLAGLIGSFVSRSGRYVQGVAIVLLSLQVATLGTAFQISGMGVVLASVNLVLTFGFANATLPRYFVKRPITASIIISILVLLLDLFEPFKRSPNEGVALTWIVGLIMILIFGYMVLRQFPTYTLRTKLIIGFVFIAVVSVGSVTAFNQYTTTITRREILSEDLNSEANQRAVRVGDLLNEQINALTVLSLNEALRSALETQIETYPDTKTEIDALIEQRDQQWRQADAADNNSDPLVAEYLTNDIALSLKEFQAEFPANGEVFVTDKYGALLGTTNRTSDYAQADEAWWQAAYDNGRGAVYISQPEFDESVGALSVQFALPIKSRNAGEVLGIIRTTYLLSALQNIIEEPIGETGNVEIYVPGEQDFFIQESGYGPVDPELGAELQAIGTQPFVEMNYDGTQSMVSRAFISTLEGNQIIDNLGWFVIVHQNTEEILAPILAQTRGNLSISLIVLVVAVAVAIGLAQLLIAPLNALSSVATQYASGDLSIRAEIDTEDEVGKLAQNFNNMAGELRNTLAGLEQRVAARTRDLELAAEVGRRLSLVRDPDTMLTEAVEVIRERFDLYYTQIYLTDASGRILVLRAGTGEVGRTLLQRAHRLAIDLASLNGTAVIEHRSVVVEDTKTSTVHRPNPLLPDTRSEMVVPLIAGERVMGVLDMQSSQPGALNQENLPAFEALAGQIAITIVNAELFTEVESARIQVENQARRLSREGWDDFLNAIESPERIAFAFDHGKVDQLSELLSTADATDALVAPLQVSGEQIGTLQLERDTPWVEDDNLMISAVAQQAAQQIENLRLLAQSERYQFEAQEALRRLTREGWDAYQAQSANRNLGFLYQDFEVKPFDQQVELPSEKLTFDLNVRGTTIGQLEILEKGTLSEEDAELVSAVNELLSAHIENLRLSQQTEIALAETEDLYRGSEQLIQAETLQDVLFALANATRLGELDRVALMLFEDYDSSGNPNTCVMIAQKNKEGLPITLPNGARLNFDEMGVVKSMKPNEPIIMQNIHFDERVSEYDLQLFEDGSIVGSIALPLTVGNQWFGIISASSNNPLSWTEDDVRQTMTLTGQAASVIQTKVLFERAQTRAQREQALRQITAAVRGSTDPATILRRAVRELGTALGRRTVIRMAMPDQSGGEEKIPDKNGSSENADGGMS